MTLNEIRSELVGLVLTNRPTVRSVFNFFNEFAAKLPDVPTDFELSTKVYSRLPSLKPKQHSHIARAIFLKMHKEDDSDYEVVKALPYKPLNKRRRDVALQKSISNYAQLVVHSFYNQDRIFHQWGLYRSYAERLMHANALKFINYLALLYYDAAERAESIGQAYRTQTVLALIKEMRQSENFSAMPILADALQDAGWPDDDLVLHLRTSQVFSLGSWVFRAVGML